MDKVFDRSAIAGLTGELSADNSGIPLNDPRAYGGMSQGMRDLFYKDTIEMVMMYYGIPLKREIKEGDGKNMRLMWVRNSDNADLFLEKDIKPVHIPLVEQHFSDIGKPFRGGFLACKKMYNDTRPAIDTSPKPKRDELTGQYVNDRGEPIDQDGNLLYPTTADVNSGSSQSSSPTGPRNRYGFDEGVETTTSDQDGGSTITPDELQYDNSGSDINSEPSNGPDEPTGTEDKVSVSSPGTSESVGGNGNGS